jgi:hypothetical protein
MAGQAMPDWEDILNAYLEGRGLRADAEDLLMRLHLTSQDREQIERSLRLSDEISGALRAIQLPVGLEGRLTTALAACPMPAGVPASWEGDREESGEEDLLDAALEGRVSIDELYAAQAAGRLSESGREALEDLEASAEGLAEVSVPMGGSMPAGLEGRLQGRLRAHMSSEEGEVDQRVVNRLLAKRSRERGPRVVMPDVLAAGEEAGDGEEPAK